MAKLTIADLNKTKEKAHADLALREAGQQATKTEEKHLLLCGGTGCHASGALKVKTALLDELSKKGLSQIPEGLFS